MLYKNNKKIILLAALAMGVTFPVRAQQWPDERPEARPGLRWWWPGSAVDTTNLRWNLEQYARSGAGAVEITPIYGVQGNDRNDIPYLSDQWMKMLQFTEDAARQDNIEVDMATGTGWPFGGPWVPIEESASQMVIVDTTVTTRRLKNFQLSLPQKKRNNTSFVVLMAFDANHKSVQIPTEDIQILPDGISVNTRLPQKTSWRIIALFQHRGVMKVKRPAPGGEGWVIDHFDKQAVTHYLQHIEQAFERTGTPYPHTFFNDSYEVSEGDYTPTLFTEFEQRRGYSLLSVFDRFVDGDPDIMADYRETLGDLLLTNFTRTWTDWAHKHGAITRNQAHGSPANLIDCYAAVDIPEIEGFGLTEFGIKGLRRDPGFTRKNFSDLSMLKYAPSAAHITGKPFTSSETFTWLTEHFRTSLSQMKPDLDLMFCAGVNHVFFHGTCYSPKDAPWPGWKFYASVDMSPTNSIWRDAPGLMNYITRCQSFLQWGQPDNDFLCYLPVRDMWHKHTDNRLMQFSIHLMGDLAPEFVQTVNKIEAAGYDVDYISDRLLLNTTFENGKLQTAAGTTYKALVIPDSSNILTPQLRAHLDSLKALGAPVIIGVHPEEMARYARPEEMKTKLGLSLIRRSNAKGHHYFICNLTSRDITADVPLGVNVAQALWFDPTTGDIRRAKVVDGKVHVSLLSGESRILQTFDSANEDLSRFEWQPDGLRLTAGTTSESNGTEAKTLNGPWTLKFTESTPAINKTYNLNGIQTWENLDDSTRVLMGTGVYEYRWKASARDLKPGKYVIDLGDVRESARVYVNDSLVGCAWAVPYQLRFDASLLRRGLNTLRIEVTNLPANRISQMDRDGRKWRIMKDINIVNIHYERSTYADWAPMPSGLNGPVRLLFMPKDGTDASAKRK
jgi:hypothetical protein